MNKQLIIRKRRMRARIVIGMFAILALASISLIALASLSGRRLVGPPGSNPILSTGGFHCPNDGPTRIHYHTCEGGSERLPNGTSPSDYPVVR